MIWVSSCLCVLFCKYIAALMRQGYWRTIAQLKHKETYTPWVASIISRPRNELELRRWQETARRWADIVRNDTENLPLMAVAAVWGAINGKRYTVHVIFLVCGTAARFLHTLFFVLLLQPHRAIVWHVAIVCTLCMFLNQLA